MVSLGEKIAKLANPTPEVIDPEDDINFDSATGFCSTDAKDMDITEISDLRRRTAPLLEDIDPTYTGKKVSRRSLGHIFHKDRATASELSTGADDDLSNSESSDEELDESIDEFSDSDMKNFKKLVTPQYNESEKEPNDEEEKSTSDEDSDDNTSDMAQQFSNVDVNGEIERGQDIKNQIEMGNRLMETRIMLQKLLVIVNKLPQAALWKTMKDKGGKEMNETLNIATQSVRKLLNNGLNLQSILVNKNEEIDSANYNENMKNENESEEIPSDTDEEMEEVEAGIKTENICLKKNLKLEDCDTTLDKILKSMIPYRNTVIQKWDEKTRLSTGRMTQKSFSGFDNSALKQIEQILQDRPRLIRRTQLKRSLYRVLGKSESTESKNDDCIEIEASISKQDMLLKDYDPEIFDDDDFYRQILKDVIESKSFGVDQAVLRKQMELQKVRNKIKRKVDTKASKGRKLRYDIHPKLVNFMATIPAPEMPDEAINSFKKHLFGGQSSL